MTQPVVLSLLRCEACDLREEPSLSHVAEGLCGLASVLAELLGPVEWPVHFEAVISDDVHEVMVNELVVWCVCECCAGDVSPDFEELWCCALECGADVEVDLLPQDLRLVRGAAPRQLSEGAC